MEQNLDNTTSDLRFTHFQQRELIDVIENENSVELVYSQMLNITFTTALGINENHPQIFKIIYSIKNGKWHKSEPIIGTYIPANEEGYEF